ncbi:helix-turn-helix transcriptional regulator [Pseudomonas aeruginosa]|uniref:helix-turn-helix transcriptional regulator n=1 Tax=Pseudomonas aeruginosa TaxID=287 RepID=UPI002A424926|nr:AlpA family phage regulatory protein [Pseudomonas aeruginosa]
MKEKHKRNEMLFEKTEAERSALPLSNNTEKIQPKTAPALPKNTGCNYKISKFEIKIIRIDKLSEMLSISRSCIYDWLNPRSPRHDPSFPKQIHLSGRGNGGAVGWRLDEIIIWLESRH